MAFNKGIAFLLNIEMDQSYQTALYHGSQLYFLLILSLQQDT